MAFKIYMGPDGIPFSDYGLYRGLEIGRQTSILSVAERGLWYWNNFLRQSGELQLLSYDWTLWPVNREYQPEDKEQAEQMFWNCANWTLDNIKLEDSYAVWKYPYPITYDTAPGWRSAHAQAVGLQLLARAAKISGDKRYISNLDSLLRAFRVPVESGGLLDTTDSKVVWYEKFADPNNRKPKVLNGMMFSVLGLYDVQTHLNSNEAGSLASEGLQAVKKKLASFDLGHWTAYDIMGKPCSVHYHDIHVVQLRLLYKITGDAEIKQWAEKWSQYEPPQKGNDRLKI